MLVVCIRNWIVSDIVMLVDEKMSVPKTCKEYRANGVPVIAAAAQDRPCITCCKEHESQLDVKMLLSVFARNVFVFLWIVPHPKHPSWLQKVILPTWSILTLVI